MGEAYGVDAEIDHAVHFPFQLLRAHGIPDLLVLMVLAHPADQNLPAVEHEVAVLHSDGADAGAFGDGVGHLAHDQDFCPDGVEAAFLQIPEDRMVDAFLSCDGADTAGRHDG